MAEFEKFNLWAVTYWLLPRSMLPKLNVLHAVGAVGKVRTSSPPVPTPGLTLTVEPVEADWVPVLPFVQAEHTLLASICPENVIVIVSLGSILPARPPLPFA